MTEVTKEEFFKKGVGNLNVHPVIVSRFPYKCEWTMQDSSRKIIGITEDYFSGALLKTRYFLSAEVK